MTNRVLLGQLDKAIRVTGTGIPEDTFVKRREYNQIGVGGSFIVTAVGIQLTKTPTASPSGDITLHFPDGTSTFVSDSYSSSGTSTGLSPSLQTNTGGSSNPVIFPPWIYLTDYEESDFQATPLSSSFIPGRQPDFGLKVSKDGADVTTCAQKDLLFDSTSVRTGLVYAGAKSLTLNDSADNFLTTGSKASLGYIPLVIAVEKNMGERFEGDGSEYVEIDEISLWKTTTSTFTPCTAANLDGASTSSEYTGPTDGRSYDQISSTNENAINVSYFVLRIPCAYGYMTSTYFG